MKAVDEQGGVIPGANVTITSPVLPTPLTGLTDSAGLYRFPSLTVGTYSVRVTLQGFKASVRDGVVVLHGTADVNVPYLQSVRLIDELVKHGKGDLVTFMMYPGEFHYFTREHVLRDAWHRIELFWAKHLKGK